MGEMIMAQAFNKFAKKYIGDIMEEEGFVPYKTTDFIRLKENNRLLQYIGFPSGKYGGYKILHVGHLPLFMPHKREDIASEIAGGMHNDAPYGWSPLSWDFPKGDKEMAEQSMIGIRSVILKHSLPYLNKYSTFSDTLQMLEKDDVDVVPPGYRRLRARKSEYKGYFALGAKDYIKAEKYFKEYYSLFGPDYVKDEISKTLKEEIEEIVKTIHDPEEIERILERNRQNTINILNLRKYIDID
ncbi:hypothetical protein [Methanosarcina sp. 1.H.A.2.2]|uniref:hypothetical protein n=1 Tax=Methanosarcina sp. 1.H.A.2.2 TaxID=1483601 RepID=UPI000620E80F|nr:hypothetical protein [Methanosarcina sp. 1.H.A.2.2]KKH47874.1 hypothetical protein EO93_13670 [Methanosarcina sp. 1.H.A.2.2]